PATQDFDDDRTDDEKMEGESPYSPVINENQEDEMEEEILEIGPSLEDVETTPTKLPNTSKKNVCIPETPQKKLESKLSITFDEILPTTLLPSEESPSLQHHHHSKN